MTKTIVWWIGAGVVLVLLGVPIALRLYVAEYRRTIEACKLIRLDQKETDVLARMAPFTKDSMHVEIAETGGKKVKYFTFVPKRFDPVAAYVEIVIDQESGLVVGALCGEDYRLMRK